MGELTHKRLLEGAQQWLYQVHGCTTVLVETSTMATRLVEIPDVLGFHRTKYGVTSILVECKASRADFLADKQKVSRQIRNSSLAMGRERWYFAPPGLIYEDASEMPDRWGLAEWDGGPIRQVQVLHRAIPFDVFAYGAEELLLLKQIEGKSKGKAKWGTKRLRPEKQAPIEKMRPCRGVGFCQGCEWPGCPVRRTA
jgi:hypothetical protein